MSEGSGYQAGQAAKASINRAFDDVEKGMNKHGSGMGAINTDKYARLNLRYPLDVEGPEESHFVRFTVHGVKGAKLKSTPRNSPEQNAEGGFLGNILAEVKSSDVGTSIGGFASGVLNSVGGAINQISGVVGAVAGGISGAIDEVTSSVGLGNLGSAALSGVSEQGLGALGGLADMPGSFGPVVGGIGGLLGFKRHSKGHIILYMPHDIKESYKADWAAEEIGIIGSMALQAGRGLAGGASGFETLGTALQTGKSGLAAVAMQKVAGIVGQESLVNLALREGMAGGKKAINPHMEQFFKGIGFRDFSFAFKFAPRNQKEANEVQAIVRAFKYYSAPASTEGGYGAFWEYPNEWGIEYWNSNRLHKITKCACTGVDVNYSGAGTNATFYDGHPIITDLSLTFVELSQMTKSRFQQADGSEGGY